jgi:hypothetical protein
MATVNACLLFRSWSVREPDFRVDGPAVSGASRRLVRQQLG